MSSLSLNNSTTGYDVLYNFFRKLEIQHFFGVTGGGVVHFLKHLPSYTQDKSSFFTLAEYSAGFSPIGYFLATRKIAASVATLGAATKLITCGLIDAKFHDIPAIYIVPAYADELAHSASLQDSSISGTNIVLQLQAEIPHGVFIFDREENFQKHFIEAEIRLKNHKPVVFILVHKALASLLTLKYTTSAILPSPKINQNNLTHFIEKFVRASHGKRITILVGEEMNAYPNSKCLIEQLTKKLKPFLIWTMNGANAVNENNEYGYGYLGFGGNDLANQHFNQLGYDDVLLILGACPDEYTVNLKNFTANHTFYCSHLNEGYGQINGSISHRANYDYDQLNINLDELIHALIQSPLPMTNVQALKAPYDLNIRKISPPRPNYTNMETFYKSINQCWPQNSIVFSDVCLAYKDRQYVTQRPNDSVDFYALYRGSAMGYVLGAAIGAKVADPDKKVFAFTGDGCFKLFAGSLAEAANLGITLFVLNNSKFSIVEQGLHTIIPDISTNHWHAEVKPIDYCLIAQACGWRAAKLNIDLSNLSTLLDSTLNSKQSLLIEIAVDPNQLIGMNPRAQNL